MNIRDRLFDLQDKEYGIFQANLTPGIDKEKFIGVRVPLVRKLANEIYKEGGYEEFLSMLPHKYYDEDMLHGLILSEEKDFAKCIKGVEAFLPYVDNWAVCDIMSPKCFKKNKKLLLEYIEEWIKSDHVYTCRFAMGMLLKHYLDDDFKIDYLDMVSSVRSNEYYINMMIAWYFATALAKQWESTVPYLTERKLDRWTHNKTIQKARESYRITSEQKEYLKQLKF